MKARAIVFTGPGAVTLEEFDLAGPGPGEVLVEAHHTCVSPGTELRCLAGRQPNAAPWPFIPGYAMAGRVIKAGAGAGIEPGSMVYLNGTSHSGHLGRMWGGHASHAVAPGAACLAIPEGLTTAEASLAHLAGIALHGCVVSGAAADQTVVVIGLGVLGQISARLYSVLGCRVAACDVNEARVATARRLGMDAAVVAGSLADTISRLVPGGPDVIADVTGNVRVIADAVGGARDVPWEDNVMQGTTYVVQGSYPDTLPVPYQDAFMKQLTLKFPRDCSAGDRRRAMELMAHGTFQARPYISEELPDRAQEVYRELANPHSSLLTVAFRWA